jgi:hypothetical protein
MSWGEFGDDCFFSRGEKIEEVKEQNKNMKRRLGKKWNVGVRRWVLS